jgi:uncharacterized protein (DUF1778 family)
MFSFRSMIKLGLAGCWLEHNLANEGARRLLDEHQRMVLSGGDRNAFLAAIGRPNDPSPRLMEALRRHRHLFG